MNTNVTIELFEDSTAGRPPRKYSMQKVHVPQRNLSLSQGVDGRLSPADIPVTIQWAGGVAADFDGVTDVKITDSKGQVLIHGALCNHYNAPRSVDGVLSFQVL